MDYIERKQWIEVCQMFFDAYVKFKSTERKHKRMAWETA